MIAIWLIFLPLCCFILFISLRFMGFDFANASPTAISGKEPGLSAYFNMPLPIPVKQARQHRHVGDVVGGYYEDEAGYGRRAPILRHATKSVSVKLYLDALRETEMRKRALLHALVESNDNVERLLRVGYPDGTGAAGPERDDVSANRHDSNSDVGFRPSHLLVDEWTTLKSSLSMEAPTAECIDLHEAYTAHLKVLRDATLRAMSLPNSTIPSSYDGLQASQQENEELIASTRLANAELAGLCTHWGIPKAFDICLAEK